jgi:hypothetical protein
MMLSGRCFAPSGPRPTCARSNLLASPIVARLLAGGIAPRDHDDAAHGVMSPTGIAGLLLEAIAGHDLPTGRMRHMIDDVLPGRFLPTICGTDS